MDKNLMKSLVISFKQGMRVPKLFDQSTTTLGIISDAYYGFKLRIEHMLT
jgi:hypothetical protein